MTDTEFDQFNWYIIWIEQESIKFKIIENEDNTFKQTLKAWMTSKLVFIGVIFFSYKDIICKVHIPHENAVENIDLIIDILPCSQAEMK